VEKGSSGLLIMFFTFSISNLTLATFFYFVVVYLFNPVEAKQIITVSNIAHLSIETILRLVLRIPYISYFDGKCAKCSRAGIGWLLS